MPLLTSGVTGVRHLRNEAPITHDRLTHMQVALDIPALCRDRVDDRHAEVLLQLLDDVERAPGGTQHVDRLRSAVPEEDALDEAVDLEARDLLHFVEIDIHASHVENVEPGIGEILAVNLVDVAAKIARAHEALDLERTER